MKEVERRMIMREREERRKNILIRGKEEKCRKAVRGDKGAS